jgi:hypothetical protein
MLQVPGEITVMGMGETSLYPEVVGAIRQI